VRRGAWAHPKARDAARRRPGGGAGEDSIWKLVPECRTIKDYKTAGLTARRSQFYLRV